MLLALMDGQPKCASELAVSANVSTSTASHHLSALVKGGVVDVVQVGRHRYHRLAGYQVADLIEILGNLAQGLGRVSKKELLTPCRSCYDHLAGRVGVAVRVGLEDRGFLVLENDRFLVTPAGGEFFGSFGLDMGSLRAGKRPLTKACIDWTERVPHLGGALGAALLGKLFERGWLERGGLPRQVVVTPVGKECLASVFGAMI
jgi:hypothetical protein